MRPMIVQLRARRRFAQHRRALLQRQLRAHEHQLVVFAAGHRHQRARRPGTPAAGRRRPAPPPRRISAPTPLRSADVAEVLHEPVADVDARSGRPPSTAAVAGIDARLRPHVRSTSVGCRIASRVAIAQRTQPARRAAERARDGDQVARLRGASRRRSSGCRRSPISARRPMSATVIANTRRRHDVAARDRHAVGVRALAQAGVQRVDVVDGRRPAAARASTSANVGVPPIAAMSLTFAASAFQPTSRQATRPGRKWTPATIVSVVAMV